MRTPTTIAGRKVYAEYDGWLLVELHGFSCCLGGCSRDLIPGDQIAHYIGPHPGRLYHLCPDCLVEQVAELPSSFRMALRLTEQPDPQTLPELVSLVDGGHCSPQCLFGQTVEEHTICGCRCDGRFHGAARILAAQD